MLLTQSMISIFVMFMSQTLQVQRDIYTNSDVRFWHKADVKTYSIVNAASTAWRCQMRLHLSVESHGAESPA